jgi:hypothetical protein
MVAASLLRFLKTTIDIGRFFGVTRTPVMSRGEFGSGR